MAIPIDMDAVSSVLLSDGWHEVHERSFAMDCPDFYWFGDCEWSTRIEHSEDPVWLECLVCTWKEGKETIFVPLKLVEALRVTDKLAKPPREHRGSWRE